MSRRRASNGVKSEVVFVPMRDGTRISVHLHRPDTPVRVPAILQSTPYGKGPFGAPPPLVAKGYATLTFDIRGSGNSEGFNDSIYSGPERQDSYDLVEWAAAQPWCNGNVGMWGISYGAVAAIQTAVAAPPHLKAIIARSGSDDPYTEWTNPGGSPRPYMYTSYGPLMSALGMLPPDPAEVGEQWADIWRQRLESNVPWGLTFIQNIVDGPFWRERSMRGHYDRVQCAVFVVDGWADWYHSPLLRIFSELRSPKRALIGPWSHAWPDHGIPGPRIDWLCEARRWFDCWLKGEDNGVMRDPPVTVFVKEYSPPATILMEEKGAFRAENEWPLARAQNTPFYFREGCGLSIEVPPRHLQNPSDTHVYDPRVGGCAGFHGGGPFNDNWAMPRDQRPDEALSLTYTTEPLAAEVEVTGRPCATLYVSSTASVALFCVKLCDVAPDGISALVTKGWLNISHRNSHTHPEPATPGQVYELAVELLTCSYRFQKGHRIRLTVSSSDFLNVWPTPERAVNTLYRDADRASHIVLPIIAVQKPKLRQPALRPSPNPLPLRSQLQAPELELSQDIIKDTGTVRYAVRYGERASQEATYTVSAADPACAVARSHSRAQTRCNGRAIAVDSLAVTSSDSKAFHHTIEVQVTVDGKPHANKSWAVSVPRGWV